MLDKKDKILLHLLQRDCTQCIQELALEVNLTLNSCWKRIKWLEQTGYICGWVALLDSEKLGLTLTAFVMIKI